MRKNSILWVMADLLGAAVLAGLTALRFAGLSATSGFWDAMMVGVGVVGVFLFIDTAKMDAGR